MGSGYGTHDLSLSVAEPCPSGRVSARPEAAPARGDEARWLSSTMRGDPSTPTTSYMKRKNQRGAGMGPPTDRGDAARRRTGDGGSCRCRDPRRQRLPPDRMARMSERWQPLTESSCCSARRRAAVGASETYPTAEKASASGYIAALAVRKKTTNP